MDRVRFGRALGTGTREAAKALARAADAAFAPDPLAPDPSVNAPPHTPATAHQPQSPRIALPTPDDLRRGRQGFSQKFLQPFTRASTVLWFEFTGSFFALFALAMAVETWKRRSELAPSLILHGHAWLAPVMLLVFAYFTVSSFLRASRRSRR